MLYIENCAYWNYIVTTGYICLNQQVANWQKQQQNKAPVSLENPHMLLVIHLTIQL